MYKNNNNITPFLVGLCILLCSVNCFFAQISVEGGAKIYIESGTSVNMITNSYSETLRPNKFLVKKIKKMSSHDAKKKLAKKDVHKFSISRCYFSLNNQLLAHSLCSISYIATLSFNLLKKPHVLISDRIVLIHNYSKGNLIQDHSEYKFLIILSLFLSLYRLRPPPIDNLFCVSL